ncbi:MAG: hypothetical protein QXL57_08615 [Candidatus Bathyarchaeia archaeon]
MKRTLLITVSAVFCGILVMLMPLYFWHKANFPDTLFVNPLAIREESLEYLKAQWGLREPSLITPFCTSLAISFVISIVAYAFLKRRF